MSETVVFWLAIAAVAFTIVVGLLVLIAKFYRKVEQGQALIVNKLVNEPVVTFTGCMVIPIIHKAEVMDISLKTIDIDRRGKEGLICSDNIRADIKVAFFVRVNKTREDVLKVAQAVGCQRASHQATVEELFAPKFSEALKTVGKRLGFESLYKERENFKDQIIEVIGRDLNGYVLEDAAIDYLEQTPLVAMDPDNILDAVGIKKITEITTQQNILTNDLKQHERKSLTKQNVEADEAVFELERQRAEAEVKQQREVATVTAREQAETLRVQAEEKAKSEQARLAAEERVGVENEKKIRQIAVAEKNRERVVAVEHERVEKDRALEAISREREVELQRIEKEKALELERKVIAEAVRERVAVDKTVAEEEERIKDVRALAEATRLKDVTRITAEGQAEEQVVKAVRDAQAKEEVAKSAAREKLTLAHADMEASDKRAQAKIRLAEGVQAEEAATGLAAARVKEADAVAHEKQGLADVRVRQAHAKVIEDQGAAEALAIRQKLEAEAAGLAEKAQAMKALDGVGREHEEYRLQLEKDKEIEIAGINMRRDVAEVQSKVLAEAMGNAKINIVGGDGQFFDRFIRAVSMGQSIDGVVDGSETIKSALGEYLDGRKSLTEDLKAVLSRPALTADALQKLSVSGVLSHLLLSAEGADRGKLQSLLDRAKDLGVADFTGSRDGEG